MRQLPLSEADLKADRTEAWAIRLPGHPPELSDCVKLLFIDACSYIMEIHLVLKSMH